MKIIVGYEFSGDSELDSAITELSILLKEHAKLSGCKAPVCDCERTKNVWWLMTTFQNVLKQLNEESNKEYKYDSKVRE